LTGQDNGIGLSPESEMVEKEWGWTSRIIWRTYSACLHVCRLRGAPLALPRAGRWRAFSPDDCYEKLL